MASVSKQDIPIDVAAFDDQGRPILIAEVKAMAGAGKMARGWLLDLAADFRSAGTDIPYWMLVDLDEIAIFDGASTGSGSLIFSIPTDEVLTTYDPDFGRKRIFDDYLAALVEAWLRDLSCDWRSVNPPASRQMATIGLADRLKGGTTRREVSFADPDPLRGNQFRDEPLDGSRPGDG